MLPYNYFVQNAKELDILACAEDKETILIRYHKYGFNGARCHVFFCIIRQMRIANNQ